MKKDDYRMVLADALVLMEYARKFNAVIPQSEIDSLSMRMDQLDSEQESIINRFGRMIPNDIDKG